jgi:hypothetical protein
MSIVDDAIEKLLADRRIAMQDAAYWKQEAEKWKQMVIFKSNEHRKHRATNSSKHNLNRFERSILQKG